MLYSIFEFTGFVAIGLLVLIFWSIIIAYALVMIDTILNWFSKNKNRNNNHWID